jgi:uncharacterized protein
MAITKEQIEKAIQLAKEFGATRLLLFGSALTDPDNANDLDIGVDGIEDSKFFLFGGILENIIHKTVDVVPLNLNTPFIDYIKKHGRYIYESA